MSSILNRNLITLLILFGSISVANAQSGAMPQSAVNPGTSGWTYVQDSIATACSPPAQSCNIAGGDMLPTTAGSVWIVRVKSGNGVTISGVSGGGEKK